MVKFHREVACSAPTVDKGGNCPVIQEIREQPCDLRRRDSLSGIHYTGDWDHARHSAAHSWINTYYFTWQHMFLALHHLQYNAMHFPMTIQHPLRVRGDSWLLWARCLQCCTGVCCFGVCVGENELLLAISQVALTFISSRHWKLMWRRHTHTHTHANSNELHNDHLTVV